MFSRWMRAALSHSRLSQAEVSRRFAVEMRRSDDRSIINKIVKGTRKVSAVELLALSKITGFPPPKVEQSSEDASVGLIPVIGYVGAGSVLVDFDVQGEIERIPMVEEATERTKALEIRGESLGDVFDRWYVYFNEPGDAPSDACIGKLCVVRLKDGRMVVKKVKAGTMPGRYTLASTFDAPIYDADIESLSPVISLRPKGA